MENQKITPCFVELPSRGLIKVGGEDNFKFLQNIVTQDLSRLDTATYVHSCLLTAQGKFLHDFFVFKTGNEYWLDCEGGLRTQDLLKRLTLYRLRAKVTLEAIEHNPVYVTLPGNERKLNKPDLQQAHFDLWDRWRISQNIADGSRDADLEKSTLAELNLEDSIDYNKGCYVGQELTARIHHRGLSKRHLYPVQFKGDAPAYGTPLSFGGKNIGEMRSSTGNIGLALLKDELLPPRDGSFFMLEPSL